MKKYILKPYFYFWLTSFVILIYRYLKYIIIGGSALDINIHDTYFVIAYQNATIILCVIFLILGFVYFLFEVLKIKLNTKLVIAHSAASIFCILSNPFVEFYYQKTDNSGFPLLDTQAHIGEFNDFLLILFLSAQLILIPNIIISLFKHFYKKNKNC